MTSAEHRPHYRTRPDAIASLEHDIRWWRRPRQTMAGLVLIASFISFITSALLLKLGMTSMPLRYAFALGLGYAALGFSLWLWAKAHPGDIGSDLTKAGQRIKPVSAKTVSERAENVVSSFNIFPSSLADAEFFIVLLLFGVVFWLIAAAPTLMAELTLDSLVTVRVYQRLRRMDSSPYLYTFWRITRVPLLIMAVMLIGTAWLLQHYLPTIHTLGDAIRAAF